MANYHDSWATLKLIYGYDTFLESLKTVCDMGCGDGSDMTWWATLESKDDTPIPYNYKCYAVDKDINRLNKVPDLTNIYKINRDFTEKRIIPVSIDLMWAHDSLQYSINPLETLRFWNEQMAVNGMLLHDSIVNSINRYGYPKQEEIVVNWLDRENYYIDWVMPATQIPESAGEPTITGKVNQTVKSKTKKVAQPPKHTKSTKLLTPVGIMRAPKGQSFTK